jgi:hypothetical protein
MMLHVLTPDERDRERQRTVETVARFDVFGQSLELLHSPTDGYYLRGDAMGVLFGTSRSDVWLATQPIHGTDDADAVELARREVLTLVERAHRRFVESLTGGPGDEREPVTTPVDTEFEAYQASVV